MDIAKISLVLPAYNEEALIRGVIDEIRRVMPQAQIVVVDDGSSDKTADVALQAGAHVLRHPYNKGNGAAIKTALRALESDYIVVLDADGQHPAEMIPTLIEELETHDLVVGERVPSSAGLLHRNLGNRFLRWFAGYLSDRAIPDLTCGLRAFDRRKALEFIHLYPNGFSFPTTNTLAFMSAGYNVCFVPFTARMRHSTTDSKIHPMQDGLRFVLLILRITTMINPLRVFLPTGLAALIVGIGWTVRNLLVFSQFSVAGALFMTVGLNILFFGIVVDQLAALRLRSRE